MSITFQAVVKCDHGRCKAKAKIEITMTSDECGQPMFKSAPPRGWKRRVGAPDVDGEWHYCPRHKNEDF
jgi:hypothetical protein